MSSTGSVLKHIGRYKEEGGGKSENGHKLSRSVDIRLSLSVVVNKDVASVPAASFKNSGAALSGLSHTSSFSFQLRVAPNQRSGQCCFAASWTCS